LFYGGRKLPPTLKKHGGYSLNTLGIKTITLVDEDLAAFYEGKYKIDMCLNQYLYIKNTEDKIVEKRRWDGSILSPLKFKTIENFRIGKVKPINEEQYALFDLLQDETITVKQITGVAGSGKNYCAMTYALDCIDRYEKNKSNYKKMVLIRNNIEVKDSTPIGSLPAGINEKLLPYAMPAADLLGSSTELFRLMDDGKIELLHLGFARGRSFDNTIVIVDECENLTGEHAALLVSRIGKNSIIMFLGDTTQADKPVFEKNSGLERLSSRLFGQTKLFGCVHLTKTERSETAALAALLQ
jgi:PhoH-like ATPase